MAENNAITMAQKTRLKKEKLVLDLEDLYRDKQKLHDEGGSTSLAPMPKEYHARLQKGMNRETLTSLQGEVDPDNFDKTLSKRIDAAQYLKDEEK